jgi:glycosyltransferase involved in cell wall biosynthesis
VRALLLPLYGRKAASTRYRMLQYLPWLEEAGIECHVAPLLDDEYLARRFATGRVPLGRVAAGFLKRMATLRSVDRFDLVVVYAELFPYLPGWVERLFLSPGIPYVVDLDDAFFLRYGEGSRIGGWLYRRKFHDLFAGSRLVIAGNEYLAAHARRSTGRVEVVPTVVDTTKYAPATGPGAGSAFTIGWIGSPSTAPYLEPLAGVLRPFTSGGSRVLLVGAGREALRGVGAERRDWSEDREVSDVREFDVGIMPLPDTPWARGKCGFKLIQYLACGVPAVASPVGVNAEIVADGVSGFLASTPLEWTQALERLRDDGALRQRLGDAGRASVERVFSLRTNGPRVAALLAEAAQA